MSQTTYSAVSKKSGKTFYLHQKGKMYFFCGTIKEGALSALPTGYQVGENSRTGLPFLSKIK